MDFKILCPSATTYLVPQMHSLQGLFCENCRNFSRKQIICNCFLKSLCGSLNALIGLKLNHDIRNEDLLSLDYLFWEFLWFKQNNVSTKIEILLHLFYYDVWNLISGQTHLPSNRLFIEKNWSHSRFWHLDNRCRHWISVD